MTDAYYRNNITFIYLLKYTDVSPITIFQQVVRKIQQLGEQNTTILTYLELTINQIRKVRKVIK